MRKYKARAHELDREVSERDKLLREMESSMERMKGMLEECQRSPEQVEGEKVLRAQLEEARKLNEVGGCLLGCCVGGCKMQGEGMEQGGVRKRPLCVDHAATSKDCRN